MFEFTERIAIAAPLQRAWDYLVRVEEWWPPSNPEHDALEILETDKRLRRGTRIRIREKIAGIPGEADGVITEFSPPETVTWQADRARYRLFGVPLEVSEGVRWTLAPKDDGVVLSATVWARFPTGAKGRALAWLFAGPMRGIEKDRRHTRTELDFVKRALERA